MATTTNYGWETPDDTDLVKDGASAIRTLGSSIDTTTKALNPETTLGDISYRSSTANTNTRLAIGTTGQVLTVNGGVPAWQTISAGGMTSLASGSIAASATGFDLTSISGSYKELWLYITNYSVSTAADIRIRTNNNSSGDYSFNYIENGTANVGVADSGFMLASSVNATQSGHSCFIRFVDYTNTTGWKNVFWQATRADNILRNGSGFTRSTSAINQITFITAAGTFDSGTYELFGVK